jgi:hypothetical protein
MASTSSTSSATSLVKGLQVHLPSVLELTSSLSGRIIDAGDNVPLVQSNATTSLEVEIASLSNPFAYTDAKGFRLSSETEVDFSARAESLIERGGAMVPVLYAFRSVSKAIPEMVR